MQVQLNKWQTQVWNDPHRFKVVCSGRRSGKSVFAQLTIINWASKSVGDYYIIAPTYRQAKEIHWRRIQAYLPQALIESKNETELSIALKNGSRISLKGADNPDALRGVELRGIIIDEIASIRNWDWVWQEVLRPTLTDYEAPAIFISTPKGFNHFFKLYEQGQAGLGDYKSWQFTSYDNPYIPHRELEKAKLELTEDTFAQEYMADFRKHTGLAHKDWDRQLHLLEPFTVPQEWLRARGFDYGLVHFTASVKVALDRRDDTMFVEECYLDNKSDVRGHAMVILAQDYGLGFVPYWGDPSGKQWVEEFQMHGINIQNADRTVGQGFKGWVEFCVEKVNERLKPVPGHTVELPNGKIIENAPRLFVINNGKNDKFVSQIEMLSWQQTVTGDVVPVLDEGGDPTGGHYDLMAALRYLVVSYREPDPPIDTSDVGGVKPFMEGLG